MNIELMPEDEEKLQEKNLFQLEKEHNFDDKSPIIEQIINKYGYGIKTWESLLLFSSICFIEGLVLFHFNLIIIPFKSLHKLTTLETQIISSVLFLGVAFGSYISGFIGDYMGRVYTLKLVPSAAFITYLAMSLLLNPIMFGIFRLILGIFMGIILPIGHNLMIENLPLKLRGFTSQVVWIAFSISVLILLIIMLGIMPNLESNKISKVLSLSSLIILVSIIYLCIYTRDSPRNLILKENFQEAFEYLELLHGKKLELELRNKIIKQVNSGNEETGKLSEIFNEKYLFTTVLLMFIWFICSMILYGITVVSGFTIKELKLENDESNTNKSVIVNFIILKLCGLPCFIIAGLLIEYQLLGRKYSMLIGFVIEAIFHLLVVFVPNHISIFTGVALAANILPFNIVTVYTSEVYSTRIRDYALGFMFFCTRIGGFTSQFLFIGLNNLYVFSPYYTTFLLSIVGAILVIMLPQETHDRNLDFKTENFVEENKAIN